MRLSGSMLEAEEGILAALNEAGGWPRAQRWSALGQGLGCWELALETPGLAMKGPPGFGCCGSMMMARSPRAGRLLGDYGAAAVGRGELLGDDVLLAAGLGDQVVGQGGPDSRSATSQATT